MSTREMFVDRQQHLQRRLLPLYSPVVRPRIPLTSVLWPGLRRRYSLPLPLLDVISLLDLDPSSCLRDRRRPSLAHRNLIILGMQGRSSHPSKSIAYLSLLTKFNSFLVAARHGLNLNLLGNPLHPQQLPQRAYHSSPSNILSKCKLHLSRINGRCAKSKRRSVHSKKKWTL